MLSSLLWYVFQSVGPKSKLNEAIHDAAVLIQLQLLRVVFSSLLLLLLWLMVAAVMKHLWDFQCNPKFVTIKISFTSAFLFRICCKNPKTVLTSQHNGNVMASTDAWKKTAVISLEMNVASHTNTSTSIFLFARLPFTFLFISIYISNQFLGRNRIKHMNQTTKCERTHLISF